jgi:hypothetical protein
MPITIATIVITKAAALAILAEHLNETILRVPHDVTDINNSNDYFYLDVAPRPDPTLEEAAADAKLYVARVLDSLPIGPTIRPPAIITPPSSNGNGHHTSEPPPVPVPEPEPVAVPAHPAIEEDGAAPEEPAPRKRSRTSLDEDERTYVIRLTAAGSAPAEIARQLDKPPSVISGFLASKKRQAEVAALAGALTITHADDEAGGGS